MEQSQLCPSWLKSTCHRRMKAEHLAELFPLSDGMNKMKIDSAPAQETDENGGQLAESAPPKEARKKAAPVGNQQCAPLLPTHPPGPNNFTSVILLHNMRLLRSPSMAALSRLQCHVTPGLASRTTPA